MYTKIKMESTFADFRMVYQALLNDLENAKRREWSLPYYLLLLFAAIIGFSKTIGLDKIGCWEKSALVIVAAAIALFGTVYLGYLTGKMIWYRRRRDDARSHLSTDFQEFEKKWPRPDFWGKPKKDKNQCGKCYSWWKAFLELSFYLTLMIWTGFGFVVWYLFLMPDC
jgi:hypothetical protein